MSISIIYNKNTIFYFFDMESSSTTWNPLSKGTNYNLNPITAPEVSKDFHIKLRERFLNKLKETLQTVPKNAICLFKGIQTLPRNWEDVDHKVDQDSNFWYLFGVNLPDSHAAIQIQTGKTILFTPQIDESYKMWMTILSLEQQKSKFNVDSALYIKELPKYLSDLAPERIFVIDGESSDSGLKMYQPSFPFLSDYTVDKQVLYPLICNLRVIKTEEELEILRYVSKIGSLAHLSAMKSTKAGLLQNQVSAVFQFQHTIQCGCQSLGFNPINASGRDCATLHYIDNAKVYQSGQLSLQDMGGKWYGYVTDQAITFPVDGKFTQKQKQIYTAVYEAQKLVAETAKQGVLWLDMHILAETVLLNHLIKIGLIVQGTATIEELIEKRVAGYFFPHGLGHFVGLLVHDVGGYIEGEERHTKLGFKSLRTRRQLQKNMVLTVEPGIYFVQQLLNRAYKDEQVKDFLNKQKIAEYMEVGGVRLEDVFIVKQDHLEKISNLPRTVEDVQNFLAS